MTAEVTSLARRMVVEGYKEEGDGATTELVTRDLLGGGGAAAASSAAEVDLELRVPAAWDRRLAPSSAKAHVQERKLNPAPHHHLHDLNLSPPSLSAASLGLKPPPAVSAAPVAYHSVCTLEKVKSALEREWRLVAKSRPPLLPTRPDGSLSPPSSSSSLAAAATTTTTSSSSTKRRKRDEDEDDDEDGLATAAGRAMAVAACPECLLYVLVCKVDPRCPRCAAHVPVNVLHKNPRIDLNFSLGNNNNNNNNNNKDSF